MRITALKAMELREGGGQSLVKVETDSGLYGVGEAGARGPATRAGLQWLEQILIGADPLTIDKLYQQMTGMQHTYQALRTASKVPICTGEKLEGFRDFMPFLSGGSVDVINPDLCWAGGFSGGREIAHLADYYYIPVTTHNVGSLVQTMACAHFGASVRNFTMSEARLCECPYIAEMGGVELDVTQGKLAVPTGPGLGIELVPEVLRAELKEGEPYWD